MLKMTPPPTSHVDEIVATNKVNENKVVANLSGVKKI